jgi:flagellar protein FliS
VETSVNTASAHKLIELLFNGFIESVTLARGAMRNRQIEVKGKAIGRAARIVEEGLKAGLDMEAGGKLAEDLYALYAYVAVRLTFANLHNDESALDECIALINPLREAWISIGPQVEAGNL